MLSESRRTHLASNIRRWSLSCQCNTVIARWAFSAFYILHDFRDPFDLCSALHFSVTFRGPHRRHNARRRLTELMGRTRLWRLEALRLSRYFGILVRPVISHLPGNSGHRSNMRHQSRASDPFCDHREEKARSVTVTLG